MDILFFYLIIINALSFLLMLIDKQKARRKAWRIPEILLLCTALAGGSLGAFLGMKLARHKTLHPQFSIGLPAMLVLHTVLLVWLWRP